MTSVTIGDPELHIEHPDLIGRRWRTGTLLLILADASFVAALVFSYLYLRGLNTEKAWLAPKQDIAAIWFSWLIAAVLALSALAFQYALRGIRAGTEVKLVTGAAFALALVVVAGVLQFVQLSTFPFGVATSAYSSCMYVIAAANLFHILLTAFLGLAMWNRGRRHIYSGESKWQVEVVGLWWTWIALAAIGVSFVTSFVTSPRH
ncbi:MAG: Cytochrome c oxidase subunit [Pseudonocardiales bacterium]|nr:Cytochrome c oxidase subunit [Pseudonocardiales bacterium]